MGWLAGYGQSGVVVTLAIPMSEHRDECRAASTTKCNGHAMPCCQFTLESADQLGLSSLAALVRDAHRQRPETVRGSVRVWYEGGV